MRNTRHVTRPEDAGSGRSRHIQHDSIINRQPGLFRQPGAGRHSNAGHHHRSRQRLPAYQRSVRADALDERPKPEVDSDLLQAASRPFGDRLPEGAAPQPARGLEHHDAQSQRRERGRHFDTDESAANDNGARPVAGGLRS